MTVISCTEDIDCKVPEVELIYRIRCRSVDQPVIKRTNDAFQILLASWDDNKIDFIEQFKVLYLNSGNKVLAISLISSGGITGTFADPRIIFATALKLNATAMILCHNHPSGNLIPSKLDNRLTQKLTAAGKLLDIQVMDHMILSSAGYYSYADSGQL